METSSDSDTTDEWIVLDDDGDDNESLIKDKTSFEDDVSVCVNCPDACVSDARTTSLGFTEEGNPPDNGEVPPAEDLEVHEHVQNFAEQADDQSDFSSYTKDELLEDIDMTPAVRHYVHKKNANLNSLLNFYLVLAVIAATALGLGNFLGWSYCSSLKGVLQKQEQMLEQLQNKLSDCNSHLNASNLLSSDFESSKHSSPVVEIKHQEKNRDPTAFLEEKNQEKTGEHWTLSDDRNLRNLIHYPLSALESRSDLSPFIRSADKHEHSSVLKHVLYFQNVKPNTINIKSGAVAEPQEKKGHITEFVAHNPVHSHIPDLDLHSGKTSAFGFNMEGYKDILPTESPLSAQLKESQLNVKFRDLYIDKHFSDMATVLDMSHFNIAFPQKKVLESQENFRSGSFLAVDRGNNLESSKITNFDIKSDQLNLEFEGGSEVKHSPSTQDKGNNYHTATLISSLNNVLYLQQAQNIREGHFKSNLNITHVIFQELLENLREKLEDIKNFTLSPLFIKHTHYSQKAVKKLLKVFDTFMGRLLKHSDKFFQKNTHRENRMDKLTRKMISGMNKLNCEWQKIKDKWQHLIQNEQSSKHGNYEENRCQSGDCNKKKSGSHGYDQSKLGYSECLIHSELIGGREKGKMKRKSDYHTFTERQEAVECLRNIYFHEKAKEQVKEKSDYQRAVEQLIRDEFFGGGTKHKVKLSYQRAVLGVMEDKLSDGRMKELLKDRRILEFLSNIYFDEILNEKVKSKSDYQTILKYLRHVYFGEERKEQMKGKLNYQRILELLRSMYFSDIAMEKGIDTTDYFRAMECFVRNKFSDGKKNKPVKDKSNYHKTVEHFGDVDISERVKKQVKGKSDGNRFSDHIAEDEFYSGKTKGKREDRSAYWKDVDHIKSDFSGRKAEEQGKDKPDVQRTVEHLINIYFSQRAEKQLKNKSNYKKHVEYLLREELFGGSAKEKMKNRSKFKDEKLNYKSKDVFEKKLKNGKGKDYKTNKKEKHSNSEFENSENNFRYKEGIRKDFMTSHKVAGKRNKSDNWGKS